MGLVATLVFFAVALLTLVLTVIAANEGRSNLQRQRAKEKEPTSAQPDATATVDKQLADIADQIGSLTDKLEQLSARSVGKQAGLSFNIQQQSDFLSHYWQQGNYTHHSVKSPLPVSAELTENAINKVVQAVEQSTKKYMRGMSQYDPSGASDPTKFSKEFGASHESLEHEIQQSGPTVQ